MYTHTNKLVIYLSLAAFLSYLAEYLYAPIYAIYIEELGGSALEAGLSWGVYPLTLGFLSLFFGPILNKLDISTKIKILYVGFIVAGILSLFYMFINNIYSLFLLQFLIGLVWSIINPIWDTFYTLISSKSDRAYITEDWSIYEGGSRIAMGIGSILGGILVDLMDFRIVFIIASSLNILAGVILFLNRKSYTNPK